MQFRRSRVELTVRHFMPNGDPRFHENELPILEKFFQHVAVTLSDFAHRHNLRLEKYYHQSPSWSFTFRHPQGGVGKIDVSRASNEELTISTCWWYDNFDLQRRSIRNAEKVFLRVDSEKLVQTLDQSLASVLAWEFGSWEEHWDNHSWGRQWTKQQFEELLDMYPVPK